MTLLTVKEWEAAVDAREKLKKTLAAERKTCTDPVRAERLRGEARQNNRLLKDNMRHLGIARGIARNASRNKERIEWRPIERKSAAEDALRRRPQKKAAVAGKALKPHVFPEKVAIQGVPERSMDVRLHVDVHMEAPGPVLPTDEALRGIVRNAVNDALVDSGHWRNITVGARVEGRSRGGGS